MQSRNVPSAKDLRAQRGFTLVEIMVVVVIIGLLATLVTGNILESADDAKITKAQADCAAIHDQAEIYAIKHSKGIPDMEDLTTPDERGRIAIEPKPEDPWGNDYVIYRDEDSRTRFFVMSMGPDGLEDTEDDIIFPDSRDDQ